MRSCLWHQPANQSVLHNDAWSASNERSVRISLVSSGCWLYAPWKFLHAIEPTFLSPFLHFFIGLLVFANCKRKHRMKRFSVNVWLFNSRVIKRPMLSSSCSLIHGKGFSRLVVKTPTGNCWSIYHEQTLHGRSNERVQSRRIAFVINIHSGGSS